MNGDSSLDIHHDSSFIITTLLKDSLPFAYAPISPASCSRVCVSVAGSRPRLLRATCLCVTMIRACPLMHVLTKTVAATIFSTPTHTFIAVSSISPPPVQRGSVSLLFLHHVQVTIINVITLTSSSRSTCSTTPTVFCRRRLGHERADRWLRAISSCSCWCGRLLATKVCHPMAVESIANNIQLLCNRVPNDFVDGVLGD
mmetsp:Transcript_84988/g.137818  ORF Transcript_84988/g.137818 Transcript_84988/m.137818 type:complete len:200 (-) Transcript_84988:92-691(-)